MLCFLDIDGVLHSTANEIAGPPMVQHEIMAQIVRGERHPSEFGLLQEEKQALLADILQQHSNLYVVISSAWRNWEPYNVFDDDVSAAALLWRSSKPDRLCWMKRLFHPCIAERIVGYTPTMGNRLAEIRAFMNGVDRSRYCDRWIAIDDQVNHFPSDSVTHFYNAYASVPVVTDNVENEELIIIVDGSVGLTAQAANAVRLASLHADDAPVISC
jgi:hypothetical protein